MSLHQFRVSSYAYTEAESNTHSGGKQRTILQVKERLSGCQHSSSGGFKTKGEQCLDIIPAVVQERENQ